MAKQLDSKSNDEGSNPSTLANLRGRMKQTTWQDKVLACATVGFIYSLLPQILLNYQLKVVGISWQTIIITCVGLYIISFCMFTLKVYLFSIANILTAILWTTILIQKIIY